jgi:hypothetical protein
MDKLNMMLDDAEQETGLMTRQEEKSLGKAANSRTIGKKAKEDKSVSGRRRQRRTLKEALGDSKLPSMEPLDSDIHFIWASESEKAFPSIATLIQEGYEYASIEDVAQDVQALVKSSSDGTGCIRANEMVLMKIAGEAWSQYLTECHHLDPQAAQERETAKSTQELLSYGFPVSSRLGQQDSAAEELLVIEGNRLVKKRPPSEWGNLTKDPNRNDFFGTTIF